MCHSVYRWTDHLTSYVMPGNIKSLCIAYQVVGLKLVLWGSTKHSMSYDTGGVTMKLIKGDLSYSPTNSASCTVYTDLSMVVS